MVCDTPYLQNEFGDPRFFYVFNLILSFSTCSQSFKKICAWELLGANVLNLKEAKATLPLSLFYLAAKKKAIFCLLLRRFDSEAGEAGELEARETFPLPFLPCAPTPFAARETSGNEAGLFSWFSCRFGRDSVDSRHLIFESRMYCGLSRSMEGTGHYRNVRGLGRVWLFSVCLKK